MAYIGNSPALKYASFEVQHFTTSATTSYVLSYSVANENEIALFVNNVRQQPGGSYAYTAAGTTLTLSAATTTSDTMYAVFIGKAVQTVIPPAGSVAASQLATDAVTTVKILDTAVTGAKLNDDSISAQTALGAEPADTDEFLVSDAGVLKRVDYSYIKASTTDEFRPNAQPLFINGDMQVAQRGTSQSGITNTVGPAYVADRFAWEENGTMSSVFTMSQETDVPTGQGFTKSLKLDCTTADTPATTERIRIEQKFEGQNLQLLKKGTASAESTTLAFWVKSNKTGTYIANFTDEDNTRIISKAYTIDVADTWEKKIINYAGDTTDPFVYDNSTSLVVKWFLCAGASLQSGTLADTWQDYTNANFCVGQVNFADSTSNEFFLTGVQLEVGTYTSSTLPPFQFETYGANLARCQRYYQKLTGSYEAYGQIMNGHYQGTTQFQGAVVYPVEMRTAPSISATQTSSNDSSSAYAVANGGTDYIDQLILYTENAKSTLIYTDSSASGTSGGAGNLYVNSTITECALVAEL